MNPALLMLLQQRASGHSITYVSSGAPVVYGNTSVMTVNPPPNTVPEDCILLCTGNRHSVNTVTADNGFTAVASAADTSNTFSRATTFILPVMETLSGLISVTKTGTSNTQVGRSFRFTKTGGTWDAVGYTTFNSVLHASLIELSFTGALDVKAGDVVVMSMAGTTYGARLNSGDLTIPGVTLGSPSIDNVSSSSGADTLLHTFVFPVLSGVASGNFTWSSASGTSGRNSTWAGVLTRLRAA